GTYVSTVTAHITFDIVLTDACARAIGGANVTEDDCAAIEEAYTSQPEEYESAACTFAPGSCRCSISTPTSTETTTGPYVVSGTRLTLDDSGPNDFCVQGDTLTFGIAEADGNYGVSAHRLP